MSNKDRLPTLTVRELISLLSKCKPELPVMLNIPDQFVPMNYALGIEEDSYINNEKYTSENDLYNVISILGVPVVDIATLEEGDDEDDDELSGDEKDDWWKE